MTTRRLNDSHDMSFGTGIADYAVEAEACAQNVKTRLLLLMGEWVLDTGAGVPYLNDIMIRPANMPVVESIIKKTILDTEGVATLTDFRMAVDRETRQLNIQATVTTIYGSVANIKVTK